MMKMPRPLAGKDGFTLLETMIALSMLAFALMAVAGLFVFAIGGNAQGGRVTEATSLAEQKLEQFKATAYPNITKSLVPETNIDASGNPGGVYTRFWSVTTCSALEVKTITVNVKWTSKGRNHYVRLSTKRAYDR